MLFNLVLMTAFITQLQDDYYKYYDSKVDQFAISNLQNGDIICVKGNQVINGFNFSQYICDITESEYSHCGIIDVTGQTIYVFDMAKEGCRRVPIFDWVRENPARVKLLRLKSNYRDELTLNNVIKYCDKLYYNETKFDFSFRYGGNDHYCAELVNRVYANARICLQQPVKIKDLPGTQSNKLATMAVIVGFHSYTEDPPTLDRKIVFAGNDKIGISSSKYLRTVFEGKIK